MISLSWPQQKLLLEGEPFRIISGAMHYFRCVPEYWEDRLRKIKAMGCNTVETYVPWNVHEPHEGEFHFEGMADIVKFIRIAEQVGLYLIVRPAPYICAEWEFGGFPAWLLNRELRLRTSDPSYLQKVAAYYDQLIPLLAPLQKSKGGPILAFQIENEYGSYGNDQAYLQALRQMLVERGIEELLFTSDGPNDLMLSGGITSGIWATANFGSRANEGFDTLLKHQPDAPLMCMEFWNGWFDQWGKEHHTRDGKDAANSLDEILARGASVNFYMAHGGTNFGFMNGANYSEKYEPTITSYDYDSPISEAGDLTSKYHFFREVIGKYAPVPKEPLPANTVKAGYGTVDVKRRVSLYHALDTLSIPQNSIVPEPMECYGQAYGFILYTTQISDAQQTYTLNVDDVRDRALVLIDNKPVGVIERWDTSKEPLTIQVPEGGAKLDLLVENMGRVNYGPLLASDRKGIVNGVRLDYQFHSHWEVRTLPLQGVPDFESLAEEALMLGEEGTEPSFYEAELVIEGEPADTFLYLDGWKKGVAFVNGFNLGRYWEVGPQRSLYVPAPILKQGSNCIVVFELHGAGKTLRFESTPQL
ncbi:glycoside hydrolase family 35 protein [Paenibacillus sp. B2(2019)]|uniref:glycoside hydrolase family 35 protein n=1 Tax=Paenibacillus sp. B2(2019) TaxID=2607754 RepID=UPI0011F1615C|nr:beta-galactosidase family protein [Paenibacillus sp. B2(2019)]KAA1189280.1 beta-galactosidase [Paenibacillus sp. B2(2019)]